MQRGVRLGVRLGAQGTRGGEVAEEGEAVGAEERFRLGMRERRLHHPQLLVQRPLPRLRPAARRTCALAPGRAQQAAVRAGLGRGAAATCDR